MSVLADIFVSRPGEAASYDRSPDEFADRAQCRRITVLELSTLWALLRGVEWDVASLDEFPCLLVEDDGERLVHELPSDMVADLARLGPDQIAVVTLEWGATEELGWSLDEARPVVESLVRLARLAAESAWGVYIWNCV
jgi:hypothetical protein